MVGGLALNGVFWGLVAVPEAELMMALRVDLGLHIRVGIKGWYN
jgi:hypothetical protein